MDKWKIKTDKNGKVHIQKDKLGNFVNREDAEMLAKKIAQENKTILFIHEEDNFSELDYTNFLTSQEIYGKQESEVKITRAELAVARVAMKKRKQAYRNSLDTDDALLNKEKYEEAKERYRKAKINLKNAKKRFKSAMKNI